MKKNYYPVIMAGGGGTRLWPLSRKDLPKQLLSFTEDKSLFKTAIDRLNGVFHSENIRIVTIEDQVNLLMKEAPGLTLNQFIIEPFPKGTASVVGLAAIVLLDMDPDAVMAILTADHVIYNLDEFHTLLEQGYEHAMNDHLVTLGIEPEYPSTGYGYIKAGKPMEDDRAFLVDQFVEKPNLETALQYIESGNYFWNSGMFIWRADRILEEISKHMPNLRHTLLKIETSFRKSEYHDLLVDYWTEITPQTIDYGIMEQADNVVMLKASNLQWNDVGSWDSLVEILSADECSNVIKAKNKLLLDCNNLVVLEGNDKKIVSAINLENLVIIDTDDALLICRKGETQSVRRVIDELKRRNLNEYL
jgi:mannose-1-phosphate guanylyltransferase